MTSHFSVAPARPAIESSATLAALATAHAGATRVFHRHRLDFCCGGQVSLAEACAKRGLDVVQLLAELRTETEPVAAGEDWSRLPLAALIDHVLACFHAPHREELTRLLAMAQKVERVHADKLDCPRGLAAQLDFVQREMELHMQKEETVLFPLLREGRGAQAGAPIHCMELEHEDHARNLLLLRELAHDYVPPPEACNTWRALYLGLSQFERDLMQHVHLENHVLFPRALAAI